MSVVEARLPRTAARFWLVICVELGALRPSTAEFAAHEGRHPAWWAGITSLTDLAHTDRVSCHVTPVPLSAVRATEMTWPYSASVSNGAPFHCWQNILRGPTPLSKTSHAADKRFKKYSACGRMLCKTLPQNILHEANAPDGACY